ncbi:MAG TPA: EthD domain-containing protein [Acidimicrobiia bacterium]|nr:EthD domain-containing protein [Acidimicrobiia bacterium]
MTTADSSYSGPVKVFAFLKRRGGTTRAEFDEAWERHARRLADTAELRRHVRRYELHHRIDDPGRERAEVEVDDGGYDGVGIMWFDSLDELRALQAEPAYAQFEADAAALREPDVAAVVTRIGDVIVPPAGGAPDAGMSLICILRHNAALALPEFHDHWLHDHGGLFQTIEGLRDPLRGYEQNHGIDLPGAEYDGVTQQWFDSLDAWTKSLEDPAHADVVDPDMRSFLDAGSIAFVLAGRPTVVVDG